MKYNEVFEEALSHYTKEVKRPGYLNGWFTGIRHSRTLYPHIKKLQADLSNPNQDSKTVLESYFKDPKTKFNNHSFSLYLIDALEEHVPDEYWGRFYPKHKQVIFYSGTVYRGTMQAPRSAFNNGITAHTTPRLEDYVYDTSMGTGVSTSTDKSVAQGYSVKVHGGKEAPQVSYGWTYKINYRNLGGVDIIQSHKARNNRAILAITRCEEKREINVIGKIEPQDIVGCWNHAGKWIENKNYQENRKVEEPKTFRERRALLFAPTDSVMGVDSGLLHSSNLMDDCLINPAAQPSL